MSEVVPARKAEPVGKLVKVRKGFPSILGVPEHQKRELSSGGQLFRPAVSLKWLDDQENLFGGLIAAIVFLDAAGALFVGLPWSLGAPATAPAFWTVYGLAQGAWVAPGVLSVPYIRGRRRNFKALVDWMAARYGVKLGAKQGLSGVVANLSPTLHNRTFTDASGQVLTLSGSSEQGYSIWRNNEEHPRTGAAKAPVSKKQAVGSLPKELRKEHDEVQSLIAKLGQRELSPESDHVVNRAERDLEKVMTLHADLWELSVITQSNLDEIEQVLIQLRAELTEVFQREAQWTLNALKIESTYVKAREERPGMKLQEGKK
jgi:hypothetical protein